MSSPPCHTAMFSTFLLVSKAIIAISFLKSSLHVSRKCILFTVMSALRMGLESSPWFAMYLLSTYFVPDTSLALAHRKELDPATLESSTFRVSFWGCVWRLGPALPHLGTRPNRVVADVGCRWRYLGLVSWCSNYLLLHSMSPRTKWLTTQPFIIYFIFYIISCWFVEYNLPQLVSWVSAFP